MRPASAGSASPRCRPRSDAVVGAARRSWSWSRWSCSCRSASGRSSPRSSRLVALYVLMGLGLNITLGLAGLLDLGFVAFFAVGAYTVGLLTSTGRVRHRRLVVLGRHPVRGAVRDAVRRRSSACRSCGIRGDYLAIATLGFGEIIRILAGSDLLKPWSWAARAGIINIPKPIDVPPTHFLAGPDPDLLHRARLRGGHRLRRLAAARLAARAARGWRSARTRTWPRRSASTWSRPSCSPTCWARRSPDSAARSSRPSSAPIFPSSIKLLVSINVVAIIIVGGMGSIPGVVARRDRPHRPAGAVPRVLRVPLPVLRRRADGDHDRCGPRACCPSRIARRELHVTRDEVDRPDAPVGTDAGQREASGR